MEWRLHYDQQSFIFLLTLTERYRNILGVEGQLRKIWAAQCNGHKELNSSRRNSTMATKKKAAKKKKK
jgi:hypothetical protein